MGTSEGVVIQSPTSFTGSARRIWKLTDSGPAPLKVLTIPLAIVLVVIAWVFCLVWLVVFGIVMVPWRLLRRGSRKRKQERLRHQETLDAVRQAPSS